MQDLRWYFACARWVFVLRGEEEDERGTGAAEQVREQKPTLHDQNNTSNPGPKTTSTQFKIYIFSP